MKLPLQSPPDSICLLRLSAVGDICHTLPVVRTIQKEWPDTKITWVIGTLEHTLVGDINDIEFIIFDKARGRKAYLDLRRAVRGRNFDVLLHMQMSLRASLASRLIPAKIRLGFARVFAKDLQWLFTNHKANYRDSQHVMDSFFNFIETLGITERVLSWDIPLPEAAREFAQRLLPGDQPTLIISPCSSMSYRNWTTEGYAEVADYAAENYGMRVVISGGKSEIEQSFADVISGTSHARTINLVGQTDLKQLLAVLRRATAVVAPDSGPAHMATTVNTPVIGLFATTNPDRARPYFSEKYEVNHYPRAIADKFDKTVAQLPWGTRVRDAGTMERIQVREVTDKLDALMADQNNAKRT